ncbi:GntR family transcriptional regulator [Herbivorax sp. ANBcel31]|uniref:GntR family transcriptional regulator n=1 Tax=Herbivorax sp. ANBcel31 TaxID=3069754 RepID=UPI0027B1F8F1|nr:GntR family transcriptional regulator [Herbivorax sp. ANBcel31]MDQ2086756.1 GntR family transcriptional regulator [Herbivorax sp. ANBcel31]
MNTEKDIIDFIINNIVTGKYKEGDKLPSENEIANHFSVTRIVVRKAYERLNEMGYINSIKGKGTFLKERKKKIHLILSGNQSFTKKMNDNNYNLYSKNVFCKKINYNEKIYKILKADDFEQIYKIGRLRIVDDRPVALHISYVKKSTFNDIDSEGMKILSMFEYYKSKGFNEFNSKQSVLSVSFPTKLERELLNCSGFVPILVIKSGCYDKETNKILEFSKIIYRSDCFQYLISK